MIGIRARFMSKAQIHQQLARLYVERFTHPYPSLIDYRIARWTTAYQQKK